MAGFQNRRRWVWLNETPNAQLDPYVQFCTTSTRSAFQTAQPPSPRSTPRTYDRTCMTSVGAIKWDKDEQKLLCHLYRRAWPTGSRRRRDVIRVTYQDHTNLNRRDRCPVSRWQLCKRSQSQRLRQTVLRLSLRNRSLNLIAFVRVTR